MDINDMKAAWAKLDSQLQKSEQHSERLVKEMLRNKSSSALRRIINCDVFNTITILLLVPVFVWLLSPSGSKYLITFAGRIGMIYWMVFAIAGLVYGAFKLKKLLQIDFTQALNYNFRIINWYKLSMQQEKKASYVAIPLGIVPVCINLLELHSPLWLWILFASILVAAVIVIILSYKYYNRNIKAITDSLEELNEMEEEPIA